jgi:hypothetical protein
VGRIENCAYVKVKLALTNLAPYADVSGEEPPDSMAEWRNAVEKYENEFLPVITTPRKPKNIHIRSTLHERLYP